MEREVVYLAALLHDIGKFYQRADKNSASSSNLLSNEIKNLEPSISPKHWQSQKYTHKHVLWTAQAIYNLQQHFTPYLNLTEGWNFDKLLRLSATHHSPSANNLLEILIQKADHYSSGIDRDKQDGMGWKDAAEEADEKWDSFKRTRMRSIFEGVSLTGKWKSSGDYKKKLPLEAINTGPNYFPIDIGIEPVDENYKKLWDDFETEVKFIQNRTLHSFNDSFLYLLEKYTSRIPSSTQHLPDVSLFDHLKTTAAFALCLYDYIHDNNLERLPTANEKPFALIGGDLSGIQKFIYNIVTKGAAKNLKGRSFYLQLLVDNVVQVIIDELGLQNGNIIYSSGGGFYLLAPNTKTLSEKLLEIEKTIAEKLFEFHGTELYLSIDFTPFGENEIFNQTDEDENIGKVWKVLGEKLSVKKGQRFKYILKKNFKSFFEPIPVSTEVKKDSITGEELKHPVKYLDDDKDRLVNEYTFKQIQLGKELKRTDYWILSNYELEYFPKSIYVLNPIGIGKFNYLVDKETLEKFENKLKTSADNVRVIYFNKENFLEPLQKGINNIYCFAWYGGVLAP
ncbi:MAG: type III-A CRISPR-associated protein Cas10/Csm1 [Bacteroidetes bacterium]|nr:type III-A CRISPR-associated protein Cas10/Csm1 [Bacteroidota bacterium]